MLFTTGRAGDVGKGWGLEDFPERRSPHGTQPATACGPAAPHVPSSPGRSCPASNPREKKALLNRLGGAGGRAMSGCGSLEEAEGMEALTFS